MQEFLERPAPIVAREILGSYLKRSFTDGSTALVRIVETEAYDQSDVASHSYNGITPRTTVMFGEPGHLYVYFTYGMHYCSNIVVGKKGHGAAVLIRAVEPVSDPSLIVKNRRVKNILDLTNGPAKLCQALLITKELNGHNLNNQPLQLILEKPAQNKDIVEATRIGISKGRELRWRYYLKESDFVSKKVKN